MTEAEAIARSQRGDQVAFAWIVKEYKHLVYTVAMRVLRHREEAEEVTQDAFVKAYQHLAGYQGGSKLPPGCSASPTARPFQTEGRAGPPPATCMTFRRRSWRAKTMRRLRRSTGNAH
ncbi:MAG: hypothetical protein IPG10_20220 [Flavobacteriales bacterium]|nr:hypothetical protein [Flavobacteriales bacterium]